MLNQSLINIKKEQVFVHKKSIIFVLLFIIVLFVSYLSWINSSTNTQTQQLHLQNTMMNYIKGNPNKNAFYPCPKRHLITYIWMKGEMTLKYKEFVQRCKENINIITEQDYNKYVQMWNQRFPDYKIQNHNNYPFVLQIEYLKKLHLYFKGGIYSDFDTQIDQTCWQNVITDKIIFTNFFKIDGYPVTPEENFIKVSKPFHRQLEHWIIQHVYETRGFSNRWEVCRMEQSCLMMLCQVHNYENTWVNK